MHAEAAMDTSALDADEGAVAYRGPARADGAAVDAIVVTVLALQLFEISIRHLLLYFFVR